MSEKVSKKKNLTEAEIAYRMITTQAEELREKACKVINYLVEPDKLIDFNNDLIFLKDNEDESFVFSKYMNGEIYFYNDISKKEHNKINISDLPLASAISLLGSISEYLKKEKSDAKNSK